MNMDREGFERVSYLMRAKWLSEEQWEIGLAEMRWCQIFPVN